MKRKMTGQELADTPVNQIFPPIPDTRFGDFNGHIKSVQHARNILDICNMYRMNKIPLSESDKDIEYRAYLYTKTKRR